MVFLERSKAVKGCFRFIAQFLAVICAIFFVVTALLVIVFFNVEGRLFDPDTYKAALEEGMIYERLPGILSEEIALSMNYNPCEMNPMLCEIEGASQEYFACLGDVLGQEALEEIGTGKRLPTEAEKALAQPCLDAFGAVGQSKEPSEGGAPMFFKNLHPQDWEFILAKLLPPEDTKSLVETALDQVFAYLDAKSNTAVLSLRQLKVRLAGPEGLDALERLIAVQPACTEAELAGMKESIQGIQVSEMVLCNPPANELQDMLPLLQEQLLLAVAGIPDEAILIQPPDPESTGDPSNLEISEGLSLARTILRLSPLVPLGFLILVTLFAVRSLKGWLLWWGIPFLVVGVIGLLMGILVTPLLQLAWTSFVQFPPYMSQTLENLALELLTYIVQSVSRWITLSAVLLAVVVVAAIIGAGFIRPKRRDAESIPV
jgi:hypothetical protein